MATSERGTVRTVVAATVDETKVYRGRSRFQRWLRRMAWRHAIAWAALFFALFPIAWITTSSINSVQSLTTVKFIPTSTTVDNYTALFEGCVWDWGFPPFACDTTKPVPVWLWNSVKVSMIATLLQLAFSTLAAYSFARLRWKGRRSGLIGILLIQMFPQFLAFVAIFLLLDILQDTFGDPLQAELWMVAIPLALAGLGFAVAWARGKLEGGLRRAAPWFIAVGAGAVAWAVTNPDFGVTLFPTIGFNTHTGLILVYLGGAIGVNTWLIKGFMDSIPISLDEAAEVDGATKWQVFWQIIVPLSKPILIVIFILSFVGLYNEFILAQILIQDVDQFTYAPGLALFVESDYAGQWGQLSAAALIGATPIVIIFLILQDRIVGGLGGAVKG